MFSALVRLTPGIESAKSCDIINMFHNCPQAVIHPNEKSDYFLAPTTCVFLEQTWRDKMRSIYLLTLPSQIEANPTKMRTRIFQASHFRTKWELEISACTIRRAAKLMCIVLGIVWNQISIHVQAIIKHAIRGMIMRRVVFSNQQNEMHTRRIGTRFYVMRTRFCMFP